MGARAFMVIVFGLWALGLVLVGALIIAAAATKKQERQLRQRQQMAAVRRRADDIREVVETLIPLDGDNFVWPFLNEHYISILESLRAKGDSSNFLENNLVNAYHRKENKEQQSQKNHAITSDNEVRLANEHVNNAKALLRSLHRDHMIDSHQLDLFNEHLTFLIFKISITAHVEQGKNSLTNNDLRMAKSHFNYAMELLRETSMKNAWVVETINEVEGRLDLVEEQEEKARRAREEKERKNQQANPPPKTKTAGTASANPKKKSVSGKPIIIGPDGSVRDTM